MQNPLHPRSRLCRDRQTKCMQTSSSFLPCCIARTATAELLEGRGAKATRPARLLLTTALRLEAVTCLDASIFYC